MSQLADYALARLVGRAVGAARLHTEERLGRREQGKAPAVTVSAAVVGVDEILGDNTALRLQACYAAVEAAAHAATGHAAGGAQLAAHHAPLGLEGVEDGALDAILGGQGRAAAAVVAHIGPPRAADEGGLAAEELAVGAAALAQDLALPLPEGPLPASVGPHGVAALLVYGLVGRPPRNADVEQRQKPYVVDVVDQRRRRMYESF